MKAVAGLAGAGGMVPDLFLFGDNSLKAVLAATGAQGMPLVVEVSVAFSVLIALFVFAVFVFRIRERFDTIDIEALYRMRGESR